MANLMKKWLLFLKGNVILHMTRVFLLACALFIPSVQVAQSLAMDLTSLSLEELMDVEIMSVARRSQKLSETAAAAFIITHEDIRRAGVTTVMDALRMAPGIQVAQIDGNKWAITARGFNNRFANKLLVLVDGRSVYSPFMSGVVWEDQDMMMEDIERIEVIRGPGASIWGANAVNGIINIITKTARDTQGAMVVAGAGTYESAFGAARFGGKVGETGYYRLYAKLTEKDAFDEVSGAKGENDWLSRMAGFRLDINPSEVDEWTFQGNIHKNVTGQHYFCPTYVFPYQVELRETSDMFGGYVLGRWAHQHSALSESVLQLYYSHQLTEDPNAEAQEDTVDVDFQHRFNMGMRHDITWGAAYRCTLTDAEEGLRVRFEPQTRQDNLFSAFFQEEYELVEDTVLVTLGSKFEHNDHTGFEIQPSLRIRWDVDGSNVIWGAVSRGVRTPSRSETNSIYLIGVVPQNPFDPVNSPWYALEMAGNTDVESETVWAYELGYRTRPNAWLSLDLSGFYNSYDKLWNLSPASTIVDPMFNVTQQVKWSNSMKSHSYGFEAAMDLVPGDWWKLRVAYSWLKISISGSVLSPDIDISGDRAPHHQASVLSMMRLSENVELDSWLRYVGRVDDPDIPAYTTLDVRLAWAPVRGVELSIVGRNLLEEQHKEYNDHYFDSAFCEVERSVYGKLTWRF